MRVLDIHMEGVMRKFLFLFMLWVWGSTVAFPLNAVAEEKKAESEVYTYDAGQTLVARCPAWRKCTVFTPEVLPPSRFTLSLAAIGGAYGINDVISGQGGLQLDMRARLSEHWGLTTEVELGGGGPVVESSEGHAGVALLASWQDEIARVQFGLAWQAMFSSQDTEMVNAVYVPLQADFFLGEPTKSGAQFFLRMDFGLGAAVWRSMTIVKNVIDINDREGRQILEVHVPDHVGGVYFRAGIGFGVTFDFKK